MYQYLVRNSVVMETVQSKTLKHLQVSWVGPPNPVGQGAFGNNMWITLNAILYLDTLEHFKTNWWFQIWFSFPFLWSYHTPSSTSNYTTLNFIENPHLLVVLLSPKWKPWNGEWVLWDFEPWWLLILNYLLRPQISPGKKRKLYI